MSDINSSQVQSTNDASTASKCSAASKKYFQDKFIEHFVEKIKPRASLINLGYYTRAVVLFKLIENFISFVKNEKRHKFQIISCGSGFDTTYWRLSEAGLLFYEAVFIEIDFPNVIKRKIELIKQSKVLNSYTARCDKNISPKVNEMNHNHFLLQADLSDIGTLENLFDLIQVDYSIPTLFLSECVITYMAEKCSSLLIKWMAEKFTCGTFVNYEQIHPNDGFGQVMLRHFEKIQSTLYSVEYYPNCASHSLRYKQNGFETSVAISEWDIFMLLTSESERQSAFNMELFDEFEEFHNKCTHYVVGLAGNGIGSNWINSLSLTTDCLSIPLQSNRNVLQLQYIPQNLELYRHCSFVSMKSVYLFGGCTKQKRSSKIMRINLENYEITELAKVTKTFETFDVQLEVVYAALTYFELNGNKFCCLYGGRTSPDQLGNKGDVILFQLLENELIIKSVIKDGNPTPRYRAPMVSLRTGENSVHCWIFGGRVGDLRNPPSELNRIELLLTDEGVQHNWRIYKKGNTNWPCNRMSHSMTASENGFSFFVSCGLNVESSTVLNDVWEWCCKTESWHRINLTGQLLPRYGHTSHVINGKLYLVGGVNTVAGQQPGLAEICLKNLSVTEYSLQVAGPHPVLLFNHTSVIEEDEKGSCRILIVGGGGNCFSFGTYLNKGLQVIPIDRL